MTETYVFPEHIQIETIRGVCTAKCIMCTISTWKRPKVTMSLPQFERLMQLLQGNERQKFLTMHGLGEPLLDKELPEKIKLAKKYQFKGVGFASNCTELNGEMAQRLLDSGLDTLICSIDGFSKAVHESIRLGTNFDKIIANVENFLALRNKLGRQTRVLVRFINQKTNCHEWDDYRNFWEQRLDKSHGDGVLRFNVHNWGEDEKVGDYSALQAQKENVSEKVLCADLEDRLVIQASGRLSFCCADDNDYFELGNIFENTEEISQKTGGGWGAYTLYNSEPFTSYRKAMHQGKLLHLAPCSTCSIITSRQSRILSDS